MSENSDPLSPMTLEEFCSAIDVCMSAMRARREIGTKTSQYFVAKALAEKLWRSNIRPMRSPGLKVATAEEYPGNPKQRRAE